MTQEMAESVKHLAKDTVEALRRIGGSIKKCLECDGHGIRDSAPWGDQICPKCKGTGKVGGWNWEEKVGEWFLYPKNLLGDMQLVTSVELYHLHAWGEDFEISFKGLIPILHWEEIERVLEGMGYSVSVYRDCCSISKGNTPLVEADGKSRQEAVMRAVIKLGEEIK